MVGGVRYLCPNNDVIFSSCSCFFLWPDSEDLVARTTIVGIIVAFRKLTLDALNSVLSYRIPFLLSSISDFKKNLPDKTSMVGLIKCIDLLIIKGYDIFCKLSSRLSINIYYFSASCFR